MVTLLLCLILSAWIAAIAILSVQNATAIAVQFLWFRSIDLPLGVILAFSVVLGLLSVAVAQLLWRRSPSNSTGDYEEENWE